MGSNYPGTDFQLGGCENDARNWASLFAANGADDVDELIGADMTREAMLGALRSHVSALKRGDRFWFSYSGHGTQVRDRDADEADGLDEALCPQDLRAAGVITDDELFGIFSEAGSGEQCVGFFDCCFSGTIDRFAPPLTQVIPKYGMPVERPARRVKFLPPAVWEDSPTELFRMRKQLERADPARRAERSARSAFRRRGALSFSACSDTEVTYDAFAGDEPCGIFSYVALGVWPKIAGQEPRYRDWEKAIRTRLPSEDYPQLHPQLGGTETQKRWRALQ